MQTIISEGYSPGCIGRVAELHASFYSQANGFGVAFEAKVAKELSDFCLSYVAGRDGLWLARSQNSEGSSIEGSIALDGSRVLQDGAHLRWFITSSALRGQGAGTQLLKQALAFADQRAYPKVYLWTFAGLDAARHLYESHGFRLEFENPGAQWGTTVLEQRFVREFKPS